MAEVGAELSSFISDRTLRPSLLTRLLLLCPQVCGGQCLLQRRSAHVLRRARTHCARMRREMQSTQDPYAPLEHLEAAARHLAVVERWLRASTVSGSRSRQALPDQGFADKLRRDLGCLGSLDEGEDDGHFSVLFSPPPSEVLVKVIPCMVKSNTFRHPGKLFLSNSRLCFYSGVMGVEIIFSTMWSNVAKVRLMAGESTKTHPVRFSLSRQAMFDGGVVAHLDFRVFDIMALGHLHRFATYFTGAGLFGMWQELGAEEAPPPETPMGNIVTTRRLQRGGSTPCMKDMVADLEQQAIVWELERRTSVFSEDWRAPFLPHDGQKQMKWTTLGEHYLCHPFLLRRGVRDHEAANSDRPPINEVEVLGQMRPCAWHVVVDEEGDCEGWQYAVDFYLQSQYWQPSCGFWSHVRRRKWRPTFGMAEVGGASTRLAENSLEEKETKLTNRVKTTLLDEKVTTTEPILDMDIGEISLEELAEALEVDDWQAVGNLMTRYFEALRASDMEVGPWASGQGAAARVKGKVRSIEMKVPVPPQPMCPPETRCLSTWHVVSTPSKVVLESVTMSLDVPYGTCFNVIACDTFTIDEVTGHTRMCRACGIEWVKSTWLKSMVEASVPGEVQKLALNWVDVLKEWSGAADAYAGSC
mmetsp:Transcript_140637/g.366138  ORF Transcript_140637/g.366138 Transcript_140637/m.366138 type:complete len:641 (+) Transcript_140637:88-2010(+)